MTRRPNGMERLELNGAKLAPFLALLALAAVACGSPEAARQRGGGPGADLGNRRDVVQFHAGAQPYHRTPCVVAQRQCSGPQATFGTPSQPE